MERQTYTIDATGKVLGRLATEVAHHLRGKHRATFAPHKDEGDFVLVTNIDKMAVTGRKMEQKVYYRHSGYLGGLKEEKLEDVFARDPGEALKKAVWNMLPKNKLRPVQIQRLKTQLTGVAAPATEK